MNALVVLAPDALTPALFSAPDDLETLLSGLEARVRAVPIDISTPKGRKDCASLARQVARSKTAFDSFGKDLVSGLKAQTKLVDVERAKVWDRIEALQAEVRKPLDDYEADEARRIADHQNALQEMIDLGSFAAESVPSVDVIAALVALEALPDRNWQEFQLRAATTRSETFAKLQALKSTALAREAEQAELARLRAEEAARAQREREERIAAEAAATATREAEERAETERLRIDREKVEAVAAQKRAEAETKRIQEQAERERLAMEQAAETNRLNAIEAERQRVADAAAAEARETARREADTAHKKEVTNAAKRALVAAGLDEFDAIRAVTAIMRGEIPNISIKY